jgi:hypothetical protein
MRVRAAASVGLSALALSAPTTAPSLQQEPPPFACAFTVAANTPEGYDQF